MPVLLLIFSCIFTHLASLNDRNPLCLLRIVFYAMGHYFLFVMPIDRWHMLCSNCSKYMLCNATQARYSMVSCRRRDISDGLRKLRCRSLIFVGENSPFHSEALDMTSKLDRRCSALVEVCITGPFASLLKFGLSVYPGLWNHVLFIETIPYRFRHVVQW